MPLLRLESGGKHAPSIATLKKYAKAVGCDLEIRLVREVVRQIVLPVRPKSRSLADVGGWKNPARPLLNADRPRPSRTPSDQTVREVSQYIYSAQCL